MHSDLDENALDQAIAWQQALSGDDVDWDGYLTWLDADPLHRCLFDEIALLDRMVDEHADELRTAFVEPATPANDFAVADTAANDVYVDDTRVARPRRWWLGGGAVAAALAFALAVPHLFGANDAIYATAPGETRRIALGGGEVVELAPASRLIVRRGDARALELAQGDAFFSISHDPSRRLDVKAAGVVVTDIGTRFGVSLTEGRVTVAVAEGELTVAAPGGASRHVAAGQQLVGHGRTLSPLSAVPSEDVGSWRRGRLVYDQMPLRIVVADLARFSGKRVSVDPSIGDRPFSGVLGIKDGSRPFENLADLMAISYQADAHGVRFVAGVAR